MNVVPEGRAKHNCHAKGDLEALRAERLCCMEKLGLQRPYQFDSRVGRKHEDSSRFIPK
jgi:hypothetical protein